MLLKAPPDTGGFITSDHPVCLMWSKREDRGHDPPPGHALMGTQVLFPISKTLAMVGTFEGKDRELDVFESHVSVFNGAVISFAKRQVYGADGKFLYTLREGEKPRRGDELHNDRFFIQGRDNDKE